MSSLKIAVIGYGIEGRAAYKYWNRDGNELTVCDQNAELKLPDGVSGRLGERYLDNLDEFDLIVRSPFVRPDKLVAASSAAILAKVTSNTNEFFKASPSRHIIGVTGTKGKGTTSTLIAKMLEASGHRAHLGGNIGVPALKLLVQDIQPDDWVVLELSSFQLIDLKQSPGIAVCLMVEPEHLDWHLNLDEYLAAKSQLFADQTGNDTAIYYAANERSKQIAAAGNGHKLPYFAPPGACVLDSAITIGGQTICRTDELKLLGEHNWQNVCAAVTAVWQVSQDVDAARSVLTSFSGLPFRLEFRREVNGVRYYNDSFATGPGSSIAAMRSIPGKKVMIMGGYERGLDLTELTEEASRRQADLEKIMIIGQSGQRLADALREHGFTNFIISEAKTMPEIVRDAAELAKPGQAVILSPGFASFDMFKNFEDRGLKFNEAVAAL